MFGRSCFEPDPFSWVDFFLNTTIFFGWVFFVILIITFGFRVYAAIHKRLFPESH